jgi:hypothetical protein
MELVGRLNGSVLYWVLKVAVPQIKGGRIVDKGGCVAGIFGLELKGSIVRYQFLRYCKKNKLKKLNTSSRDYMYINNYNMFVVDVRFVRCKNKEVEDTEGPRCPWWGKLFYIYAPLVGER